MTIHIIADELRKGGSTEVSYEDFYPSGDKLLKLIAKRKKNNKNGRSDDQIERDAVEGEINELGIHKPLALPLHAILGDSPDFDVICYVNGVKTFLEVKTDRNVGHGESFKFNISQQHRGLNLEHFLRGTTTPYLITASHDADWIVTAHYIFHRDAFEYKQDGELGELEFELNYNAMIDKNLCVKI